MRAAVRAARDQQPAAPVPPVVQVAPESPPARVMHRKDELEPHRRIEKMDEKELREYALQVGVNRRDAANLRPDVLRQNIILVLQDFIDS